MAAAMEDEVREFDWGRRGESPIVEQDRVLTVPNAISAVRLAGLPLFVWLLVGPQRLGLALAVLVTIALTDWVDGYVARRFNQVSRIGKFLDPLIDRAMLATATIALWAVGFLPLWVLAAIVVRDLLLLGGGLVVFKGPPTIPVSRIGKAATACLLIGVPGFLLGNMDWPGAGAALVAAYVFSVLGVVTYWLAGFGYLKVVRAAGAPAGAGRP